MHVSRNLVSSSLLAASPTLVRHEAETEFISEIVVDVRTLSQEAQVHLGQSGRGMLNIDVQGAELDVLFGAEGILDRIDVIDIELSFVELYKGQVGWRRMDYRLSYRFWFQSLGYNTNFLFSKLWAPTAV